MLNNWALWFVRDIQILDFFRNEGNEMHLVIFFESFN